MSYPHDMTFGILFTQYKCTHAETFDINAHDSVIELNRISEAFVLKHYNKNIKKNLEHLQIRMHHGNLTDTKLHQLNDILKSDDVIYAKMLVKLWSFPEKD